MSAINPFAAPGELEVVRRFINTLDIESGIDGLATISGARTWLESWGLIGESDRLAEPQRRQVVDLREALRGLALANHTGEGVSAETFAALDRASSRLVIRFGPQGPAPNRPERARITPWERSRRS